jgi:predicted RNase H-like HicB family nuclease
MHNEFTAIIEKNDDWFIAYCPEIPGANGQGLTKEDCLKSLSDAIKLILEDQREDTFYSEAIPRHTEIPNKLAKKIFRMLSIPEK